MAHNLMLPEGLIREGETHEENVVDAMITSAGYSGIFEIMIKEKVPQLIMDVLRRVPPNTEELLSFDMEQLVDLVRELNDPCFALDLYSFLLANKGLFKKDVADFLLCFIAASDLEDVKIRTLDVLIENTSLPHEIWIPYFALLNEAPVH